MSGHTHRTRRVLLVVLAVAGLALPWLAMVPSAVWYGLAVIERCDEEIRSHHGDGEDVVLDQGQEGIRWFPPSWRCPATNGKTFYIWP